ncbi:MAG: hypothetical protein H0X73_02155 [Chthoniobacterales bacterium]|nr:hypothetical protein [Chthoniobacterales bacterium]
MRVTALLPTHDLSDEAVPWMEEIRDVFDELVVFLDEKRLTTGTLPRIQKVATRVERYTADCWYDWDLASMARECKSEWVFVIERDEQLSPEWKQSSWRELLKSSEFTHFLSPRRWIVPGGRYIVSGPWWPDLHLRLFRNDLAATTFPKRLHDTIQVPGPGGTLTNLAIYHHVLWLCDRNDREKRVEYYEQLRPGGGLRHYYLYEDYAPTLEALPPAAELNIQKEIGSMEVMPPEQIHAVRIVAKGFPALVKPEQIFWITVTATNRGIQKIASFQPHPVRLAYHWVDACTGDVVVFDGLRTELFPGVGPFSTSVLQMVVSAPPVAGSFVLEITLVQEGIRWFEKVAPELVQRCPIVVAV